MRTINISLPQTLAKRVDSVINREGYASRSEFIRALIRFYLSTESEKELKLLPFKKVPLSTLEAKLRKSGRHNEKFIKSVIKGISRSSIYDQSKSSSA